MHDQKPAAPAQTAIALALRRRLFYAGGAAALLGLVAGVGIHRWRNETVAPGTERFWAQRLDLLDGRVIEARSFLGRPLLVNFWATWCPPCIEEMPLIDSFYVQYRSKNHQVLGIAIDKPAAVKEFVGRVPIQYPLAINSAEGATLARDLGNLSGGLPFTVFFTRDGKVAQRKTGKLSASDLQAWSRFDS